MNRRKFLATTSAGLTATVLGHRVWSAPLPESIKKSYRFRSYRDGRTRGKVTIVTPDDGYYIHTFYDVCPWSPSGRYLAVTRLPFQDRDAVYGDTADVCVVDLHEQTIDTLFTTKAWGFQLGANLNWGTTDRYLYTNDAVDGQGVCTRIDLETREARFFAGPMTHIAPDESHVLGFPLERINASQRGYGMPEVPGRESLKLPVGTASDREGVWKTELADNKKSLIASVADFFRRVPNPDDFRDRAFYLFFSKYNRQGTRCLQFLRGVLPQPKRGQPRWIQMAFSHEPDGSDITMAVSYGVHAPTDDWRTWRPDWKPGGHHITWTPDGEHFTMNLKPDGQNLRFCHFKFDGSDFRVLSERFLGSGHPSLDRTGRFLIADAYPFEPVVVAPSKEVPIRLIRLAADEETQVCTVYTLGKELPQGGTLRCDPHPCWSRDGTKVCFNGAPDGRRQVFIADLKGVL